MALVRCQPFLVAMTSHSLSFPSALLSIKLPLLHPPLSNLRAFDLKRKPYQRRIRGLKCRADFSQDAPFAFAIGACILNSLVFPISDSPDDDSGSAIDSTDARTNLSLSPEESWLPIASIVFCIIHIQLEASIRNGDLKGFQLFNEALKYISPLTKKKNTHFQDHQGISKKGREKELMSAQELRDEIRGWEIPERTVDDPERLNEDGDAKERRKD
ncbi:hypothetical protein HHK36_029223 [Tetracentron sinense]|uniref:Uncharacterized protein n=1 Tax=Tetracentron sinense TaxID=13715 RepID=A0A834YEI4_TETSI|nr:hypothetical protein HHK36_029223 [Tetracentron sinense]